MKWPKEEELECRRRRNERARGGKSEAGNNGEEDWRNDGIGNGMKVEKEGEEG
jgi:hypothetical protein